MKNKLNEWLNRYSGPELLGLVGAYAGVYGYTSLSSNDSEIVASIFGTWGENIGYYYSIFIKDYKKSLEKNPKKLFINRIIKISRGIIIEFGIAEILDSFLIRPFCLYVAIQYLGPSFGILLGKIAADIVFYLPTIFFYEVRKKFDS